MGGNRKPCTEILKSRSDIPPGALHHGSNWGNEISDFVFLAFISFIIDLKVLNVLGSNIRNHMLSV